MFVSKSEEPKKAYAIDELNSKINLLQMDHDGLKTYIDRLYDEINRAEDPEARSFLNKLRNSEIERRNAVFKKLDAMHKAELMVVGKNDPFRDIAV